MGQKTNPNIFRLDNNNSWGSKYIERKSTELQVYSFRNLEIEKFIRKFFKDQGLIIAKLKVNYVNSSLKIFITYYLTPNSVFLINNLTKTKKIKLIKKSHGFKTKNFYRKKYSKIKNSIGTYLDYKKISYFTKLNKSLTNNLLPKTKRILKIKKKVIKPRRIRLLKNYKNYLNLINNNAKELKNTTFLRKFLISLNSFHGEKIKTYLVLSQLNVNTKQKLKLNDLKNLKKVVAQLRRYQQNDFFKEGVNVMFTTINYNESVDLIANFISNQLKILKRHNFFLKFLKSTLTLFLNRPFSKTKGIKIKIKGRFNGAPRAKHKILNLGAGVPVLSHSKLIRYSESTSYTSNGTFGVKIWLN